MCRGNVTHSKLASFILFTLVILMFSSVSVTGQITASLNFDQFGSSKMPFNFNQPITYKVHLINDMSYTMIYKVELEIGPDYTDCTASKKYTGEVNSKAQSSTDLEFVINFLSPDLNTGQFKKWAFDEKDTSSWENAWYRVVITPYLLGDVKILEDFSGKPAMIKTRPTEFRNPTVSPQIGSNQMTYHYQIEFSSDVADSVTLQASPSTNGPWTDCGDQDYTTPGNWQTLKWEDVSLEFDFYAANYRFVSRKKQSDVFEGPICPVKYAYKDEIVNPTAGYVNTLFTYRLEFKATKPLDVVLNVWDANENAFKPVGKAKYRRQPQWEKLEWYDVRTGELMDTGSSSSYYFSFYYPESENCFSTTREDTGMIYQGPSITQIGFDMAMVFPPKSSVFTPYVYCVVLNSSRVPYDVELQTLEPGSSIWKSQGIATFNGDDPICWDGVKLNKEGLASYRFICEGITSNKHSGPTILPVEVEGHINPQIGNVNETYVYTAHIEPIDDHRPIWIDLEIYDPVHNNWIFTDRQYYQFDKPNLDFTVDKLSLTTSFLGELRYRFISEDKILAMFQGPTTYHEAYRNVTVTPEYGDGSRIHNYQVEIISNIEDVIKLEVASSPKGPWINCGSREYSTPGNWQSLKWENVLLDFDFYSAYYKFVGREQTDVFEGPFWPAKYAHRNECVTPESGLSGTAFSYSLEFKANRPLDVGLEVWDVDQNRFKLMEKMCYQNVSNWEILEWHDVQPSSEIDSEGASFYYFNFYYPKSDSPFSNTGSVYPGPDIVPHKVI